MIKLTIDNSVSKVEGLDRAQFNKVRNLMSYTKGGAAAHYTGGYPQKVHLMDKNGSFPTGLLYLLYTLDAFQNDTAVVMDRRVLPKEGKASRFSFVKNIVPYEEQLEIVRVATRLSRGTISAVTGFGKSITMALLVQSLGVKTLIVVPNLTLKEQLKSTFKELFGNLKDITIENIDSPSLNKKNHYDLLLIDEGHHVAAKTYRKLNKKMWNDIYYRYFFTATPFRNKEEEKILFESVAGRTIYRIGYMEAMSKGYVAPVEAYYVELPKTKVSGTTWGQVYKELVSDSNKHDIVVCNLLKSFKNSGISTLCLVKEVAHGKKLGQLSSTPFVSGQEGDRDLIEQHASGRISSLIGTVGVLGEGVDTRAAEIIILAGLGRSKPAFMQQVGRGIRKYPGKESCKVILMYDSSHKWTRNHFKEQCKILKDEYRVIPVKLSVD